MVVVEMGKSGTAGGKSAGGSVCEVIASFPLIIPMRLLDVVYAKEEEPQQNSCAMHAGG